ncbi:hypothetical protein [Vibrio cholerae]|uniref:hypothetical protein n=1 Tax=Vibrio cholerae TaxID=666 RepID=UPI00115BEEFE|nr:hypothetical protein [Vibrio cholerae]TQQ55754.1 hypothetical protein FLL61_18850 [Vibrio cholerae]
MRPETLLAKFDLKGINYQAERGGKGIFSLEDQLAMVGITWKESPVGFLVLFVELLDNAQSRRMLEKAVCGELNTLTCDWRGQKSDLAFAAMVNAAVAEAITPMGQICSCCGGSGKYLSANRHYRDCVHCQDGRVAWNVESRFASMCASKFVCTFSVFKRKYHPVLEELSRFLSAKRNAAMLALMDRIQREEAA